jgi:hypothetical protein
MESRKVPGDGNEGNDSRPNALQQAQGRARWRPDEPWRDACARAVVRSGRRKSP